MSLEAITNYGMQTAQAVQVQSNVKPASQGVKSSEQDASQKAVEITEAQKLQIKESEQIQAAEQAGEQRQNAEQEAEQENEKLRKAVSEMNKKITSNAEAVFGFHDKTNRVTIKMVDKDTKKVIKEFPPDKTLDMIAKVWELAGIMVDEKR